MQLTAFPLQPESARLYRSEMFDIGLSWNELKFVAIEDGTAYRFQSV